MNARDTKPGLPQGQGIRPRSRGTRNNFSGESGP
jgi:hypothetical protein